MAEGIESFQQTQMYLCNVMMKAFDVPNFQKNSQFKISKVFDINVQKYEGIRKSGFVEKTQFLYK